MEKLGGPSPVGVRLGFGLGIDGGGGGWGHRARGKGEGGRGKGEGGRGKGEGGKGSGDMGVGDEGLSSKKGGDPRTHYPCVRSVWERGFLSHSSAEKGSTLLPRHMTIDVGKVRRGRS